MPFKIPFTPKEKNALSMFVSKNPLITQVFQTGFVFGVSINLVNQLKVQFPKIANWLIEPIKFNDASKLVADDQSRIKRIEKNTANVYIGGKKENISVSKKYKCNRQKAVQSINRDILLTHLQALKLKKYNDLYIRFGDGSQTMANSTHNENFQCFFGGISPDGQNHYYKKDGNNFIDVAGSGVSISDVRFTNFEKRNNELFENKHGEYYECNSIGGLTHNLDKAITYIQDNYKEGSIIFLIPGYDIDPSYVVNAPCLNNPLPQGAVAGISTIIFSNQPKIGLNKLFELYADRGNGCCG